VTENTVKITVKVGEAIVEVEGSETYVDGKLKEPDSFDALITKLGGIKKEPISSSTGKTGKSKAKKAKKSAKTVGYEIVKDLTLGADGQKAALKAFFADKRPTTNYERNTVFVYYLSKIKETGPIGINHIYTCYKEVGQRTPSLSTSLSETSQKGWLDTSSMYNIQLTVRGEDFVEHDLPKAKEAK